MFYFKVRECNNDYVSSRIYSSEKDLSKGSVVVIADYEDIPMTAYVEERVKDFIAMTANIEIEPVICIVDMKSYTQRLETKTKEALLIKKMNEEVNRVKNFEQLKKFAEKDEGMRALMKEYEDLIQVQKSADDEGFL